MKNLFRPKNFHAFIGQVKQINALKIMIRAAKQQRGPLDHILLVGPQGVGKTSLAQIVANEFKAPIRFTQGALLEKRSDVLALLGAVQENEIIFIDEIHNINKKIEELFYLAMEDSKIDLLLGPQDDAKVVRLSLPNFTLVGATTKFHKISRPFRDRFGVITKFSHYEVKQISEIIANSAQKIGWKISPDAQNLIASHSLLNPRIANNLLKRVIDVAVLNKSSQIEVPTVQNTFNNLGVYKLGLRDEHLIYLRILYYHFKSEWINLETIASLMSESQNSIKSDVEPILLEYQLILKSTKGRKILPLGQDYLLSIEILALN